MILYANVDDQALIINEVLPEELFKKVSNFNYKSIENRTRDLSHKDWQKSLHEDDYGNSTMAQVETVNLAKYENKEYDLVTNFSCNRCDSFVLFYQKAREFKGEYDEKK